MSVTGRGGIGIPIVLLHEGEGLIVTVEMKNGETYRGLLDCAEDNFNFFMRNVTKTSRDGKITQLLQIYLRGSQVTLVIFPDMYDSSIFRQLFLIIVTIG